MQPLTYLFFSDGPYHSMNREQTVCYTLPMRLTTSAPFANDHFLNHKRSDCHVSSTSTRPF